VTVIEADVAVIGAGSVGSMASWQLAARGLRVVGIDRFPVPGPFSAYAGESRVFRMVYAEGGHYTPLLQRCGVRMTDGRSRLIRRRFALRGS
jgi:sarcosine oxidase